MADIKWPLRFRQRCAQRSASAQPVTLVSDRARALVRGYAQRDADGTQVYAGPAMIEELLGRMRKELEDEYDTALQRHVRLREVV